MKYLIILLFLAGCGIRKETEIRKNYATKEDVYCVWVYNGDDIIESFQTPIIGITQNKIDSVNRLGDSLVALLKRN